MEDAARKGMKPIRDDALLRDMIIDAQRYSEKLRRRRAWGITRCEPPDVLAFYDRQIADTDYRLNCLHGRCGRKKETP